MAANIVQINVSDALSPGSSYTPANWVAPGAGNTVVMIVFAQSANISLSPTIATPVLSGETWTVRGTGTNITGTGTNRARVAPFSMNTSGGEAAPAIGLGNMTGAAASIRVICIEVNQTAATPLDGNSGVLGNLGTSNPATITSSSFSTTNAPDTLIGVCFQMGPGTGTPSFVWGGSGTTFVDVRDDAYHNSIASSVAIAPAATVTSYFSSVTITASTNPALAAMYVIAFRDGTVPGAAGFASISSMSAAGVIPISGAATLTSVSSLGAAATETDVAAASFVSISHTTADSTVLRPAAMSAVSVSSFGGTANTSQSAAVGMVSVSSLSAAPTESLVSAASMVSVSSTAASASASVPESLGMTSVSSLAATPTESLVSVVGMTSVSSMTSDATAPGAATGFVSDSTFGSAATRTQGAAVGMTSVSLLGAAATVGAGASTNAVSTSSFGAVPSESLVGVAGFVSVSHFVSNAQPPGGSASFLSISTLDTDASLAVPEGTGFQSTSSLTSAALIDLAAATTMVSLSSFSGSVVEEDAAAAQWTSISSMVPGAPGFGAAGVFISISVFTADAHAGGTSRDITLCFRVGVPRWSTITGSGRWAVAVGDSRWSTRTEEPGCGMAVCN